MCTPSKVDIADSSAGESSSNSGSDFRILRLQWKAKIMKGLWSLLVKSGPGDLNRQEEMKIERVIQKRIKSPGHRSRLNQESDEW